MASRTLAKDVHNLLRNISSLSGGQASVVDWDMDNLESMCVEISPTDGAYKGGKFKFQINITIDSYPSCPPIVNCMTEIYHPNIDTTSDYCDDEDYSPDPDNSNICLNILEQGEWDSGMGLEDCIQGLLFLFYNPNFDDPLSPLFCPGMDMEEFENNVLESLRGGEVEGFDFKPNYGFATEKCDTDVNDIVDSILSDLIDKMFPDSGCEKPVGNELENLNIENEAQCKVESDDIPKYIIDELISHVCREEDLDNSVASDITSDIVNRVYQEENLDQCSVDNSNVAEVKVINNQGCFIKDTVIEDIGVQGKEGCVFETKDINGQGHDGDETDVTVIEGQRCNDNEIENIKVMDSVNSSEVKDITGQDDSAVNTPVGNDTKKSVIRSESCIDISDNYLEKLDFESRNDTASTSSNKEINNESSQTFCSTVQTVTDIYKSPSYHKSISVEVC